MFELGFFQTNFGIKKEHVQKRHAPQGVEKVDTLSSKAHSIQAFDE